MKLEASLSSDKFGNSLFNVLAEDADGVAVKRTLPLEDFVNLIAGNTVLKKLGAELHEVNRVPKGCLKLRIGAEASEFDAMFFLPEEMTGAKVLGDPMRFLQPKRVVFISHRKAGEERAFGRTILKIFAVKDDESDITDKTALYHYPLGHVGKEGNVCTGNAGVNVTVACVEDALKYMDAFFTAESQGHFYSPSVTEANLSYGEFMEVLANSKSFPYDWLKPAGDKFTVKSVWQNFGN